MFWLLLGPPQGTKQAAVTTNKDIKVSSFKRRVKIRKKEDVQDRFVSQQRHSLIFSFNNTVNPKTDINPNRDRIAKICCEPTCMKYSQNISSDLKGTEIKYKLHYRRSTGLPLRVTRNNTRCSDNKSTYKNEFP